MSLGAQGLRPKAQGNLRMCECGNNYIFFLELYYLKKNYNLKSSGLLALGFRL
jgi:hypothetical protein